MFKTTWTLLKRTFTEWSDDNVSTLAAALSYYAIFSIGPMLLIAVAALGFVFGERAAHGQLHAQIRNLVGPQQSGIVEQMIEGAGKFGSGIWATIIGVVLLIYSSTNLFVVLQSSLNRIWDVEPKPGRGIKGVLYDRAISFGMVVFLAILLLASVAASAVISKMVEGPRGGATTQQQPAQTQASSAAGSVASKAETKIAAVTTQAKAVATTNTAATAGPAAHRRHGPKGRWFRILTLLASLAVFTVAFAVLFKYLPDVQIAWRDVMLGAVIAAVLFTLGKWGLGFYFAHSSTSSVYGAAGSLVLLMIFIYYASQIVFLCAEFTQVWARAHGSAILPAKNAVSLGRKSKHRSRKHKQSAADETRGGDGSSAGKLGAERSEAQRGQLNSGPAETETSGEDKQANAAQKSAARYPPDRFNVPGAPATASRRKRSWWFNVGSALSVLVTVPLLMILRRKQ